MPTKTLADVREELAAKRAALNDIFEEAGPNLDLSLVKSLEGDTAAKAAEIKRRNDELTALGKEYEGLKELDDTARENRKQLDWLNKPAGGMTHPAPKSAVEQAVDIVAKAQRKGLGQLFVESVAFKGYERSEKRGPIAELDVNLGETEFKTTLTETGFAPQSVRTGMILPGLLRRPVVADLLPQGTTNQIAIVYMEETTTTNNAATVAEGGTKPESALAFTERSTPVRKIATVLPITDELMQDVDAMRSYVEARLRVFLALAEESQLLTGDGNAPNLTGLLNASNLQTQAKGADPTPDAVYKAMVKIQTVAFLEPSGVIFNPLDWQDVRLLRTADGIYIWGAPMDPGPERIWGLPVVSTTAMTQNTALVGAFDTATQIFRRAGVTFAVSDQHNDNFVKNILTLRVEERLALVVYRGQGLCQVTGV